MGWERRPPSEHPLEQRRRQQRIAEITEMIHVASLLHDDVIDAAATRRGLAALNSVLGNKVGLCGGYKHEPGRLQPLRPYLPVSHFLGLLTLLSFFDLTMLFPCPGTCRGCAAGEGCWESDGACTVYVSMKQGLPPTASPLHIFLGCHLRFFEVWGGGDGVALQGRKKNRAQKGLSL